MKTLIFSILAAAISFSASALPQPLVIEGNFIKEKNVDYELYVMDADSSFCLLSSQTGKTSFSVQTFTGATYLIRFISDDGVVKFLLISPEKKGSFMVDVDFGNDNSAELYYSRQGYSIRAMCPDFIKLPSCSNVADR